MKDLIAFTILAAGITLFALIILFFKLKEIIVSLFYKNCFECSNYYTSDVAITEEVCWHSCKLHNHCDKHKNNQYHHYRRCKDFSSKLLITK